MFPAGLTEVVEFALREALDDVDVVYSDSSCVVYRAVTSEATVANLRFLKNSFAVLVQVPQVSTSADINRMVKQLKSTSGESPTLAQHNTFRVMYHADGQLTSLPRDQRAQLENTLCKRTGGTVQPRGNGDEYWLITRREANFSILGRRLPSGNAGPAAQRGVLSKELCDLMIRVSQPLRNDTFLYPFAGSGALANARLQYPARSVISSDIADNQQLSSQSKNLKLLTDDALTLDSIPTGSVDTIVTDPPWGEHEDLPTGFVDDMAHSFARVLDPDGGRLVMLIARQLADRIEASFSSVGWPRDQRLDILVNGHPASILISTQHGET